MSPFVAALIDRSTDFEKTAPMTSVHTRYSQIVVDATGVIGQRTSSEEDLGILGSSVYEFKKISTETFEKHYESGLCTL